MEVSTEPINIVVGDVSPGPAELASEPLSMKAAAEPIPFESESQPFVDHERENVYWRENYRRRPYYRPGRVYFDYQPAFRYGWESAVRVEYRGKTFDEAEKDLSRGWLGKGITWKESREAVRDAWNRVRDGH